MRTSTYGRPGPSYIEVPGNMVNDTVSMRSVRYVHVCTCVCVRVSMRVCVLVCMYQCFCQRKKAVIELSLCTRELRVSSRVHL